MKIIKFSLFFLSFCICTTWGYVFYDDFSKINKESQPLEFGYNTKTKTLNLYFSPHGQGLGNRLKMLVSYLRFYKPENVNMYWPSRGWVNAKFSDLFVLNLPINIYENNTIISYENKDNKKIHPLFDYIKTWGLLVTKTDFGNNLKPFSIDCKYEKIPQNIKNIYLHYFGNIKPSQYVANRLKHINLPSKFIGVQVRNAPDWEAFYGANEPLQSFFDVMDQYPSDTVFYLSAMSKEIANYFYEKYPKRIIELPDKNYNSMIDAVADMYILGSTDQLLCSFHSSFCEVAWWLGGANASVVVIGSGKNMVSSSKSKNPRKIMEDL